MARSRSDLVGRALLWLIAGLALLATAVLTLPRLVGWNGKRAVELIALTPFGSVPALVLLAAALTLVILHRRGARWVASVLTLLGTASTALHVLWLAPLYIGSKPAAASSSLVVLTQNLEYGSADALAQEVRDRRVDVLVLCDLGETQWASVQASTIQRALPHRVDSGGDAVVFSRYPLTDDVPIRLHGGGRSVRIESSPLGPVTLFALHPVQPYRPGVWQEDARHVVQMVRAERASNAGATIVAGDLNATLDHWPLRELDALGMTDAADAANGGFQPTFPASGRERRFGIAVPPLFQIDHVLVSPELVVTSVERVHTAGADHLGVLARIALAAR